MQIFSCLSTSTLDFGTIDYEELEIATVVKWYTRGP